MKIGTAFLAWMLAFVPVAPGADDFAARCADRAAIERVYHAHRTGSAQTFEEAIPPVLIERLVRQDAAKESALRNVYHVEVAPAMLAAEVRRINTTTRAPEVLAEIKHALGDSEPRFANAMARPLLVERELRRRFDHDAALHAAQRHQAEQARAQFFAKQTPADARDVTWQLTQRPAEQKSAFAIPPPTRATKADSKGGIYSNEATAQLAQTLSTTEAAPRAEEKAYFSDLDPELQRVLGAQLRKPGDVSAVVEMPGVFLVFAVKSRNAEVLVAAAVTFPKRSYDEWLAPQPE